MLPLEAKAFICTIICIGIVLLLFYDSTLVCKKRVEKYVQSTQIEIEAYTDACGNKPSYEDYEVVMDVYNELLGRRPNSQELADYGVRIYTKAMTRESLVTHIKSTYEYKQRMGLESNTATNVSTSASTSASTSISASASTLTDPDRDYVMNAALTILTKIPSEEELQIYLQSYQVTYKRDKVLFEGWLRTKRVAKDGVKEYDYRPEIRSTFIRAIGREPTETEFLKYSPQFKNGSMTSTSLYMELTKITTPAVTPTPTTTSTTTTTSTSTSTNNLTTSRLRVSQIYREVFLKDPTEVDLSFYTQKFIDMNRDETKLIQYMKDTPEYRQVVKVSMDTISNNDVLMKIFQEVSRAYIPTGNIASTVTNVANAAVDLKTLEEKKSTTSTSTTSNPPVVPVTPAPATSTTKKQSNLLPIDGSTFEEQDVDLPIPDITNDPEALATYRLRRHMDQMRMECEKEKAMKQYTNATDDLVLIPGQEWSVPQQRPPICYQPKCNTSPLNSQTALLGTLLEDADNTKVGSIMPTFTFIENK
jgi:hypothetical protein